MNKKTFTVKCEMEERWIPYFMAFLNKLSYNGNIGHSSCVGFYADGDGDFRPKFESDIKADIDSVKPIPNPDIEVEVLFDAG